jgi:hypothetical protein
MAMKMDYASDIGNYDLCMRVPGAQHCLAGSVKRADRYDTLISPEIVLPCVIYIKARRACMIAHHVFVNLDHDEQSIAQIYYPSTLCWNMCA